MKKEVEEEEAGLAEITLHALIFTPPFDGSTHTHTHLQTIRLIRACAYH